jgi:hypothetical protein
VGLYSLRLDQTQFGVSCAVNSILVKETSSQQLVKDVLSNTVKYVKSCLQDMVARAAVAGKRGLSF